MDLLARIERTYDAIPRRDGVRVESVGPFELFVRESAGYPFYARPRLGTSRFAPADVEKLLARQRELEVPQAIEWVLDVTPGLVDAVGDRLAVRECPLMVLDPALLAEPDGRVVLLDPDRPEFATTYALSAAVAAVAFGPAGDDAGAGPVQRDAVLRPAQDGLLSEVAAARRVDAVVADPVDGVVARGTYQHALGAAEIVGVATLPSARRRGHAAAVTAVLARHALAHGNDLVFLAAADEEVARMYARVGFRRVATAGIAED